ATAWPNRWPSSGASGGQDRASIPTKQAQGLDKTLWDLVDRDDRPRDFVVDRLPLRVPQLPEPTDGADDADRETHLEHPAEAAQRRLADLGVLAGGLVPDLETEHHHPDRLAA